MLGATFENPYHVSRDDQNCHLPFACWTDIPVVNKTNDLTGFDVKPKMMLINLETEMKAHDESHEKLGMLGATFENPFHVSRDAPVHGFKDIPVVNKTNDLTGFAVKPKMMLINLESEMKAHDESHEKLGMLGATFKNPFHVSRDSKVVGFKDIPVVNKRNDLTGFDVKPKMIMLL